MLGEKLYISVTSQASKYVSVEKDFFNLTTLHRHGMFEGLNWANSEPRHGEKK